MRTRLELPALIAALAGVMTMTLAGCDKPQVVAVAPSPTAAVTPPQSTSMGTDIDDTVVTGKVKSALFADADVKGMDFQVETRQGLVQLSGFADNQAQIDRAIAVTRAVEGVKSVENNVSLKGATTTLGEKVDDGMVTGKVKAALLADASVKSLDIAVITNNGAVQLSGFVENQGQIDRAVEVARGIEGARSVSNEMSVKK
jgi:hyperosmotically inducible protein